MLRKPSFIIPLSSVSEPMKNSGRKDPRFSELKSGEEPVLWLRTVPNLPQKFGSPPSGPLFHFHRDHEHDLIPHWGGYSRTVPNSGFTTLTFQQCLYFFLFPFYYCLFESCRPYRMWKQLHILIPKRLETLIPLLYTFLVKVN